LGKFGNDDSLTKGLPSDKGVPVQSAAPPPPKGESVAHVSNPVVVKTRSIVAENKVDVLYAKFVAFKDLNEAYAAFTALADSNPEALYFRANIIQTCLSLSGPIIERLEKRASQSAPSPTRIASFAAFKAGCKNVPVETLKESPTNLIREAARQGDPKAQAYLFRFEEIGIGDKSIADTSLVRSLALSRDPVVLNNLDAYFDLRNNKLTWDIPGLEGPVSGAEMANAFRLTACALGYDCSASSIDAQIACAYRGYCDGDRVAQIRNNLLSPAGFERVERIRDVILVGFSTGKWPDGFWSGIGRIVR
jgi:hypothetical protein